MKEEYNDYDDARYDDEYDDQMPDNKAVRGYRIVIIILAVILVALSALYFRIHRQQQAEYVLLEEDRNKIQNDLDSLIVSFDDLKIQNDSIAANLDEANKLMEQLKNERRLNYAKIRAYEKEVGTLRTVMQGYIRQIDSLNTLNKRLANENVSYKKQISTRCVWVPSSAPATYASCRSTPRTRPSPASREPRACVPTSCSRPTSWPSPDRRPSTYV